MPKECFNELLQLVSPLIEKQDTKLRKAIPAQQRLSVMLWYLATGESRRSLEFQYRISHNIISEIIPQVCRALRAVLKDKYLNLPTTTDQWENVASEYYRLWNFPLCIGAMDGKRFLVRKPPNSGSEYYDYKLHHSIIMLAVVDAHYNFLYVDVGTQGRVSDAGVWDRCSLNNYLQENKLQVPDSTVLPFTTSKSPYVLVGDDAFH
ncbi:uncharacterized protein LOC123504747 [Portunus trituberculatus]|uniref:uncharacterized protein LOC123504747 n=1 Tax=Portunus trituberculatus TaxID=210409 RepID=UPI001E1CB6BD|nr:uncharacterized protein LOC123504747 [Portunus trituberculatus]